MLKMMAKIDIRHIPYKGSAPSAQDLMGGQIMLGFDSILQNLPQIRSGRLKALAVLGKARSPTMPDVPTVAESGVPGYDLTNWFGLVLPAATPGQVSKKISDDVIKVLALQDVRDKFSAMGATVVGDSPQEFGAYMRDESAKWANVIKVAGIQAQ
jgi:tripartite-type tricarboxylate transporter receptor subunit TctC